MNSKFLILLIVFCLICLNPTLILGQKPNILLIISDDLNTRIGPYMDIDQHTPNLDRLASQGVKFSRAYCQYPICGPSRASLMSGLYPQTNGVLRNNDQPGSYKTETPALADHPSMAGFFRENGYYSARVSKIYHMGVPGGIEQGASGGDDPTSWDYAYNVLGPETQSPGDLELLSPKNLHYGSNFAQMILPDQFASSQTDYLATSQAIALLESRMGSIAPGATNKQKIKPDAPFFLAVGLVRPHVPLIAPASCFEPYPEQEVSLPSGKVSENVPEQALRRQNERIWGMNEQQKKQTISAYMASVRFMDQQVGRLMDALDRLDARRNTIVIFVSDHGYNLGEHNCWSKISLWEGSLRVPLIISAPGFEASRGKTSHSVVELIDLYPTLIELAGYDQQIPEILQGESLVPLIEDTELIKKNATAYSVSYGGKDGAIINSAWKYTCWGEGVGAQNEELYHLLKDPEEYQNLVDDPSYREVLEEMRKNYDSNRQTAINGLH
ncbi:MAG: sulfatase [Candidatus Cyclobacteriaceae bacterium M3_2C_046]